MPNPFQAVRQPDMRQAMQQIKENPQSMLKQAGYNIPDDMKDGQQIINYLLQSGQVTNYRLQGLMRLLNR